MQRTANLLISFHGESNWNSLLVLIFDSFAFVAHTIACRMATTKTRKKNSASTRGCEPNSVKTLEWLTIMKFRQRGKNEEKTYKNYSLWAKWLHVRNKSCARQMENIYDVEKRKKIEMKWKNSLRSTQYSVPWLTCQTGQPILAFQFGKSLAKQSHFERNSIFSLSCKIARARCSLCLQHWLQPRTARAPIHVIKSHCRNAYVPTSTVWRRTESRVVCLCGTFTFVSGGCNEKWREKKAKLW